jgi:ArsR family transcriptional regulator, arsenate/arsenite/antimonite-responsive transcriptional repressor
VPKPSGATTPSKTKEPTVRPKREVLAISRALSDPRRFEILQHIAAKSAAACSELRGAFPITPATLSHHLKELESCGLIETARRGKFVDTTFCRPAWEAYLKELNKI